MFGPKTNLDRCVIIERKSLPIIKLKIISPFFTPIKTDGVELGISVLRPYGRSQVLDLSPHEDCPSMKYMKSSVAPEA